MQKPTLFLVLLILLTACSLTGGPDAGTTPSAEVTQQPVSSPTATLEPVSLVILILPPDMPQAESDRYQGVIYNLAQGSGYRFQVRSSLTEADLQAETSLKIVVAIGIDPGLTALSSAAPGVQFLVANVPGLAPAANLSTVGATSDVSIQQAFIAGYIASLLSPDYRVGIITLEDDGGGQVIQAFGNGRTYYCGVCNPAFPPYYKYPVHPQIPVGTSPDLYSSYTDYLKDMMVDVAFVDPRIATPALLTHMAQLDLQIISERLPFLDLQTNWVASLQPDIIPALESLWTELIAGNGGQSISIPLLLNEVNPELLGEGKQRMVQEVLDNLQAGLIGAGVNP